jgi:hypothetical protein
VLKTKLFHKLGALPEPPVTHRFCWRAEFPSPVQRRQQNLPWPICGHPWMGA